MIFSDFLITVERYLLIEDADVRTEGILKSIINDSIMEFSRIRSWEKLKLFSEITLDDSNSYLFTDILTDYFIGEQFLTSETGQEYTKYNLKIYNTLSSKANTYSIYGDKLYIQGTEIVLGFYYLGLSTFPLLLDDDTNSAIVYYYDIIKSLSVINYLKFIGDDSFQNEIGFYQQKIQSLIKFENRINNEGKPQIVTR